ncbi:MAG TPA: hypothetical protein VMV73_02380 [Candidatus Dormibacteraeota bacterium]|nr:hypothetical protein [Candidatus Dormibacteraeota bacterium]
MRDPYEATIGAVGARRYFENIDTNQLSHGYLFAGAGGVGKKSFARYLAGSLLCERSGVRILNPCGECRACRLFTGASGGTHPDFIEHDGALKIGESGGGSFASTEEATSRDLIRQLAMQSYSGGRRVLLLADVEFASAAAANALLKFFEEPPSGVTLLLTSSTPSNILATIRSRLIEIHFASLTGSEIESILRLRGFDSEAIQAVSQRARGSVTRALELLDTDAEAPHAVLGRWFEEAIAGATPSITWASRESLDDGLLGIKALLRDLVVEAGVYGGTERRLDLRRALRAFEKIDDAQRLARTNVSPTMVADLVRMAISGIAS